MKSPITCHVLDTALGKPANGIKVTLYKNKSPDFSTWESVANGETDFDGRCSSLLAPGTVLEKGVYKMHFKCGEYFDKQGLASSHYFYPYSEIVFKYEFPEQHHHIPLLLSPFGYTTYRGS